MYYAFAKKGTKKYYFTGTDFDSVPFKMKKYSSLTALQNAVSLYGALLPKGYSLYSEKVGASKKIKKKTIKKAVKKAVKKVVKKKAAKKKKSR